MRCAASRLCPPAPENTASLPQVLDALVSELVTNMPLLQRLIDAIALLDVMRAFSEVGAHSLQCARLPLGGRE
jgi:hypothetical protein